MKTSTTTRFESRSVLRWLAAIALATGLLTAAGCGSQQPKYTKDNNPRQLPGGMPQKSAKKVPGTSRKPGGKQMPPAFARRR